MKCTSLYTFWKGNEPENQYIIEKMAKKQFLVKNSEIIQKSSKDTNLGTTFFFLLKLIVFELLTKT